MEKEVLEQLPGLECVDVVIHNDDSFAMLFDDGIIIYVDGGTGVVFSQGTGWEEYWAKLKK